MCAPEEAERMPDLHRAQSEQVAGPSKTDGVSLKQVATIVVVEIFIILGIEASWIVCLVLLYTPFLADVQGPDPLDYSFASVHRDVVCIIADWTKANLKV